MALKSSTLSLQGALWVSDDCPMLSNLRTQQLRNIMSVRDRPCNNTTADSATTQLRVVQQHNSGGATSQLPPANTTFQKSYFVHSLLGRQSKDLMEDSVNFRVLHILYLS